MYIAYDIVQTVQFIHVLCFVYLYEKEKTDQSDLG